MKAFLWYDIDKVSNNWHPEGSTLIVAESLQRARELAKQKDMEGTEKDPDDIFEANGKEEKVWVFINTGCC